MRCDNEGGPARICTQSQEIQDEQDHARLRGHRFTLALSPAVLAGRYNYDYQRYSSDRNCYQKADNKGLSGDKRRKFINDCLDKPNRY